MERPATKAHPVSGLSWDHHRTIFNMQQEKQEQSLQPKIASYSS